MMLTVDITYWSFLKKEYFVSVLFTDTFITSAPLNFNMCSWHWISIPIQINVCYLAYPKFHAGTSLPQRQTEFSPLHSVSHCFIYFLREPQGPRNKIKWKRAPGLTSLKGESDNKHLINHRIPILKILHDSFLLK